MISGRRSSANRFSHSLAGSRSGSHSAWHTMCSGGGWQRRRLPISTINGAYGLTLS